MKGFLFHRLIQFIIVLIGASFLTFAIAHMAPSDPAQIYFQSRDLVPSSEMLEAMRIEMGLERPFLIQYADWLLDFMQGDLGYSYSLKLPIADMLGQRLIMTLWLAVTAIVILFIFALILGITAALNKGKWIDRLINFFSAMSISIPSFWLGLILMYYFVVKLRLFRISYSGTWDAVILPAFTLAIPLIGRYAKQVRAAVLNELNADYVLGALTRGVDRRRILFFHILPNTLFSLITLFGMTIAALLGGTAIVENIFSWPGLGSMALDAINYRDYTLLQAYVIFMAFIYVTMSLIVDIITQLIDPRLHHHESEA